MKIFFESILPFFEDNEPYIRVDLRIRKEYPGKEYMQSAKVSIFIDHPDKNITLQDIKDKAVQRVKDFFLELLKDDQGPFVESLSIK